jgi:hypothetical protein
MLCLKGSSRFPGSLGTPGVHTANTLYIVAVPSQVLVLKVFLYRLEAFLVLLGGFIEGLPGDGALLSIPGTYVTMLIKIGVEKNIKMLYYILNIC